MVRIVDESCRIRQRYLQRLAPFATELFESLPNPEGGTCRYSEKEEDICHP